MPLMFNNLNQGHKETAIYRQQLRIASNFLQKLAAKPDPSVPNILQTPKEKPIKLYSNISHMLEKMLLGEKAIQTSTRLTGDIKGDRALYEVAFRRDTVIGKKQIEKLKQQDLFKNFEGIRWTGGNLVMSLWGKYEPPEKEPPEKVSVANCIRNYAVDILAAYRVSDLFKNVKPILTKLKIPSNFVQINKVELCPGKGDEKIVLKNNMALYRVPLRKNIKLEDKHIEFMKRQLAYFDSITWSTQGPILTIWGLIPKETGEEPEELFKKIVPVLRKDPLRRLIDPSKFDKSRTSLNKDPKGRIRTKGKQRLYTLIYTEKIETDVKKSLENIPFIEKVFQGITGWNINIWGP